MYKAFWWSFGIFLVIFLAVAFSRQPSEPDNITVLMDCDRYATAAAGGEAFKGSFTYLQAKSECEMLNAHMEQP